MSVVRTEASPATRRKLALTAWRERAYTATKIGAPLLSDERLRELGGEQAVQVYHEGIRAAKRELRRRTETSRGDT